MSKGTETTNEPVVGRIVFSYPGDPKYLDGFLSLLKVNAEGLGLKVDIEVPVK